MKKIIPVLFVLLIISLSQAYSQKAAYVEQSKILQALSGYEEGMKEIDSLTQVYSLEIQEAQMAVEKKIEGLLSKYQLNQEETLENIKSKLTEIESQKLDLHIEEIRLIERSAENFDLIIQTFYNQKIEPLLNKVNNIIELYAKTNQIQMVYILEKINSNMAYIDKEMNITEEIIKELNKK